jgi:hypothetical protein
LPAASVASTTTGFGPLSRSKLRENVAPGATEVPATDSATSPSPLFEGSVVYGTPRPVCATGEDVTYRELDPATGSYRAATRRRTWSSETAQASASGSVK